MHRTKQISCKLFVYAFLICFFKSTHHSQSCIINQYVKVAKYFYNLFYHLFALLLIRHIREKMFSMRMILLKKEIFLPANSGSDIPAFFSKIFCRYVTDA